MSFGSREVPTARVSTSAWHALHCWPVFVRLILLLVFAVAIATGGGGPADAMTADSMGVVAEVADGEPAEVAPPARFDVPIFYVTPVVRHGTEVLHSSPELARVFRPPRLSFV